MKRLSHRVAAITGAASGIGRALAVNLATAGCRLAICDLNEEGLDQTARLAQAAGADEVITSLVDVSKRDAVYAWKDEVIEHFGECHIIINNAGVSLRATVEDMDYDDFQWLMDINFWGVVYGTKAFLPHLKEAEEGHIVNISSIFGIIGVPTQSAYNASKFAVRGFTESLREEMLAEGTNVGVSSVHPGGIKTDIVRNGRIREMRQFHDVQDLVEQFDNEMARTTAEQAAAVIVKGMQKKSARILVGTDAKLIDRLQRSMPSADQDLLVKFYRRNIRRK